MKGFKTGAWGFLVFICFDVVVVYMNWTLQKLAFPPTTTPTEKDYRALDLGQFE